MLWPGWVRGTQGMREGLRGSRMGCNAVTEPQDEPVAGRGQAGLACVKPVCSAPGQKAGY